MKVALLGRPELSEALAAALHAAGHELSRVARADDDVIVIVRDDLEVALELIPEDFPDVPVVVAVSGAHLGALTDVVDHGGYGVLDLDDPEAGVAALEQAGQARALAREVDRLRAHVESHSPPSALIGGCAEIERVRARVARLARSSSSIMISGESGTGKEVIARALHDAGGTERPFVALNCSAFPEQLLESQLFGHVKGAFTDARKDQRGLILEASGGTLFLDEIGDMPLSLQPKLLRVLQERKVRPLGSNKEIAFESRVVSATHRDLEESIADGRFREDLYYRLCVVELDLPPLRARGDDILELANHFLVTQAALQGAPPKTLSPEVAATFLDYAWPGNVRELANAIERAVALAEGPEVQLDDLPPRLIRARSRTPERSQILGALGVTLDEVERAHITSVYEACGRNQVRAAAALGIDRKTLRRKLSRYS